MKTFFAIAGLCTLLAVPAFAQTDNAAEGEDAAVEAPTTEEVDAAVTTINTFAEDPAKTEGYCAISREMEGVAEDDEAKAEEVATKMDEYLISHGEEIAEAFATAEDVDPESEDGQKIDAALDALEQKCAT
ncbi:MAG: hypothetical protein ACFCUR_03655 [Rhodomicrobiaceae bacterium]